MSYTTLNAFKSKFGESELIQLTDRDGKGVYDEEVFDAANAETDAEIDASLSPIYTLPLSSVPVFLTSIANDLTREKLYTNNVPESVQKKGEVARKNLGLIRDGKMSLGLPTASEPASNDLPSFDGPDSREWDADTLGDFK